LIGKRLAGDGCRRPSGGSDAEQVALTTSPRTKQRVFLPRDTQVGTIVDRAA
jgi:hypothetical protein